MLGASSVRYATKEFENAVQVRLGARTTTSSYGDIEAVAALTAEALRDYLASPLPA